MPLTDEKYRAGAIDIASQYCRREFKDGELPAGVEIAVDMIIKGMKENKSVQSQSLGDMSKSFFQDATHTAALQLLKPYRKVGFR